MAKSPNDFAHDGIVRNSCRARRQMFVRHTWCLGFDPLFDSLELVMHRLHCVTNRGSSRLPRFDDLRQQTPPLKWVLHHALSLARCICQKMFGQARAVRPIMCDSVSTSSALCIEFCLVVVSDTGIEVLCWNSGHACGVACGNVRGVGRASDGRGQKNHRTNSRKMCSHNSTKLLACRSR